jgi:hypothetical protein
MANLRISQLPEASALEGDELIPIVQDGITKHSAVYNVKNYIVAEHLTAEADVDVDLGSYTNVRMFKFSWTGGNGTAVYTLPDATTNTNRLIRFIGDGTLQSSRHIDLTPVSGQNLDGSSSAYRINNGYEGIAIWSDGSEWFMIQRKA